MSLLTDALRRLLRRPRKVPIAVPVATLVIGLFVGSAGAYALVVTGAQIKNGTVTAADLATNSVAAAEIRANAVGTSELAKASVRSVDIANGAVTGAKVANNSLMAADLAMNSVKSEEIANGTITAVDIQAGAIDADAIGSSAVGADELATSAVGTAEILDGTITAGDLDASFLATIVNSPSRVYLPNGSASGWGAHPADSIGMVVNDVAVYDVAANPCTTGRPVGVTAVLLDGSLGDGNPLTFSESDLSGTLNPQSARSIYKQAPSPRFLVHVKAVDVAGSVDDLGLIIDCA